MDGTPSSSQTKVLGEWRPPPSVAIFQFRVQWSCRQSRSRPPDPSPRRAQGHPATGWTVGPGGTSDLGAVPVSADALARDRPEPSPRKKGRPMAAEPSSDTRQDRCRHRRLSGVQRGPALGDPPGPSDRQPPRGLHDLGVADQLRLVSPIPDDYDPEVDVRDRSTSPFRRTVGAPRPQSGGSAGQRASGPCARRGLQGRRPARRRQPRPW